MLVLIITFTVVFLNFFLGLFVLLRNSKKTQNRVFAVFASSISAWALSNYLSNVGTPTSKLFFNKFAYTSSMFSMFMMLIFSLVFPHLKKIKLKEKVLFVLFPFFFIASLTNLVVAGYVERPGLSVTDIVAGKYYLLYVFYIILLFSAATYNFTRSYKVADTYEKARIKIIGWAIGVSFTWVAITSALIPYFTQHWELSKLGPVGTAVLVAGIAYTIVKHKLFDLRLVVARSFAYVLTMASIVMIYALSTFVIFTRFFGDNTSIIVQQLFYLMTAIFLGFAFQPIKHFFDRITNTLFYRDAYETQVLLDTLNKVLVGTIELGELLKKSSVVIGETLKSDFCIFGIKEVGSKPIRIIGATTKHFSGSDIQIVRSLTPKIHTKVIVTDELEDNKNLQQILRANDIAVLVRLTERPSSLSEGLGYIILGSKKSGNPYSTQDIKVLEIIADELVIAIQNSLRFEEIQNFAKTLQEKVDDATRQLRRTNEKLKQLDQTKDDFISMASHQLRTPLTSVKGYVSMVMEGDAGKINAQQRKLLDQAFVSSQRMVYLIADLLNVSRLRTGKFIIEAKPTNLADVVEGEIAQLTETAKGRGLELTYAKPKDFPDLMLDDTKIRQVIMNFADNAIYYTPAGGHIQVGLENKGDSVEFTVSDDGIGVPKAEQHHLFNKFYRAGNAKKARPDGTGLGLFMAKKVIIAQGGAIIFKTQEGKGSTFGFSFAKAPLSPAHYKAPKDAQIAKPAEPTAK
jgi:signal transduction histidine kinase